MAIRALVARVRYTEHWRRFHAYSDEKGMKMSKEWDVSNWMSSGGIEVYLHWRKRSACWTTGFTQHAVCLAVLSNSPITRPAFHL